MNVLSPSQGVDPPNMREPLINCIWTCAKVSLYVNRLLKKWNAQVEHAKSSCPKLESATTLNKCASKLLQEAHVASIVYGIINRSRYMPPPRGTCGFNTVWNHNRSRYMPETRHTIFGDLQDSCKVFDKKLGGWNVKG